MDHSLDRRTPLDMIIMDFSKAFGTVPHKRLLFKLQSYGITGNIHQWITNFLTKRTQRVVVNGENSEWVPVKSGVPQGTVLGPLFFLIYLTDLPDNISSEVRLFADDCILYRPITSKHNIEHLQADLDTLTTWQDKWQIALQRRQMLHSQIISLQNTIHSSVQAWPVSSQRSLITLISWHQYISHDLKWAEHINSTISKANRVLGAVHRNLHPCHTDIKSTAYKSLVRPHLEYSATVWDPYTTDLINKLEAVQQRAARCACRDYSPRSSVTEMLQKLEWDSLQTRRSAARLSMMFKIVNDQVAVPASKFLQPALRPTRHHNSKLFLCPQAKKDGFNNSFFPRTIAQWNTLPESIVNSTTTEIFKEQVISHLRTQIARD